MSGELLFKEIGLLSDTYVEEAGRIREYFQQKKKTRAKWFGVLSMAACLVAVCTLGLYITRELPDNTDSGSTGSGESSALGNAGNSTAGSTGQSTSTQVDAYALTFNKVETMISADIYIPGHFWEELTQEEAETLLPYLADTCEISGTVNYQSDNGSNPSVFNIDIRLVTANGCEAYLQIAPGKPIVDYILDVTPEVSYIQNVPVTAGAFEGNQANSYFAEFEVGEAGYYIEMRGGKEEKAVLPDLIDKIISGGEIDFSIFDAIPPELRDERLTLEEAYKDEDFGSYLPKELLSDLSFESAFRFVNQESDYLYTDFTKGYSYMGIRVSYLQDRDEARITSAEDTVNYDLALYPIPMGESVPRELWEIVDDPIFRAEELTLEVILKRVQTWEDAGDTDGPRMRFGILYDTGVLVEINSKGPAAEEIWEMIQTINP